jgi:hypothetical protein
VNVPLYAERNSAEQRIGTEGLAAGTKKKKLKSDSCARRKLVNAKKRILSTTAENNVLSSLPKLLLSNSSTHI